MQKVYKGACHELQIQKKYMYRSKQQKGGAWKD
jgi:hypothetical protein